MGDYPYTRIFHCYTKPLTPKQLKRKMDDKAKVESEKYRSRK